MRIDFKTWDSVRSLEELGVAWGMIELPDGTVASSEFVYWVFSEGMEYLKDGEELLYVIVSDDLWVIEHGTNRRVIKA